MWFLEKVRLLVYTLVFILALLLIMILDRKSSYRKFRKRMK